MILVFVATLLPGEASGFPQLHGIRNRCPIWACREPQLIGVMSVPTSWSFGGWEPDRGRTLNKDESDFDLTAYMNVG
jgi:hypothetical protein